MKNVLKGNIFKKIVFIVLISAVGFLINSDFASAQYYKIHEQIPGQAGQAGRIDGRDYGEEGIDTLQDYLESAYKFGIAIVAILAVIMIGVGGFMYIVTSAGNAGKLANAKEIITSAILGLVMALLSWLILFVINPDLVGNALEGVELDRDNNTWKNDYDPDPDICKDGNALYEAGECSGDYVCTGDTCVPKKNICSAPGQPKVKGVCHQDDPVAHQGESCGVIVSGQDLAGTCYPSSCSNNGLIETLSGKQCVDEMNYCCVRGL